MRRYMIPKGLLATALLTMASFHSIAAGTLGFQQIEIGGYFLIDRSGKTSLINRDLSTLSGLKVDPTSGSVMEDPTWASQNKNTFTATVPFGYKISHWVYEYGNFYTNAYGTAIWGSEGEKTVTWDYTDVDSRVYLAPVLAYDDRRTVTVAKSPFGLGTVVSNVGTYACMKGDRFHLKATPVHDEKTGFDHSTFRRWSDGVTSYERTFTVDTNMNLVAEFVPNSWRVTFDALGGEVFPTSKVVTCDAAYGWLPTPTRKGYNLIGWYLSGSSGNACNRNTTVKPLGDHTLHARWEAQRFVIAGLVDEASADCGTVTGGGEYAYDTTAVLTANPDEGFSFAGWTDGYVSRSRRIHVISNATYSATFDTAYYTVTFGYYDSADRWVNVSQTVAYGQAATPPEEGEKSKHGNLPFLSWSTEEYKCVTRDLTVTAQYETTYKVQFAYCDRYGNAVTSAVQRVRPGESATPPPSGVCNIWTGHDLVGWQPDYSTIGSDCIITAQYEIKKYDVVFYYCDEAGEEQTHLEVTPHGECVSFDFVNSVKNLWEGHTFIAWSVNGRDIVDDYLVASNDMQVVARYEGYARISFDGNGEDGGEMPPQVFTNVIGDVKLRKNAFTKTGHVFDHWNGSDGEQYKDGATVTVKDGFTLDLLADWNPIRYTIVFDGNGGTIEGGELIHNVYVYPVECAYGEAKTLSFKPSTGREGCSFVGLGTNKEDVAYACFDEVVKNWHPVVSNLTTVANSTVPLYAIWTQNVYTVTIDGKAYPMSYGDKIERPNDPAAKPGYTFAGWATNGVLVTSFPLTVPVNGLALTSVYEPNEYEVEFVGIDATGGEMENQTFTYGTPEALDPNAFTKTGYGFAGWATNETDAVVYDDEEEVSNLTTGGVFRLYAKWTANDYTVRFHANEGSGEMPDQSFVYDKAKTLSAVAFFPPSGQIFDMWTNGVDAATYQDGAVVSNLTTSGVFDLYATWKDVPSYSIEFLGAGGFCDGLSSVTQSVPCGVETPLAPNRFVREGHSFANWTNEVDAVGYADGAKVKDLANEGETYSLSAIWNPIRYSIAFNGNGATSGAMEPMSNVVYDVETNLTANGFAKTGYTFSKWSDGENLYDDEATVSNLTATADEEVELKAQWTANKYTIRFNPNGGAGEVQTQNMTYDTAANLNDVKYGAPSEWLVFGGWTNSSGVFFSAGQSVSNLTAVADGVADLYAKWNEVGSYYVHFDGNGATSGEMENQRFKCGEEGTLELNRFANTGRSFKEWSDSKGNAYADGALITKDLAASGETANLLATWTNNIYWCFFRNADGSKYSDEPYQYGESVSKVVPEKTGYDAAWTTNGVPVSVPFAMPDRDLTLVAAYTPHHYRIVFDGNGVTSGSMDPMEDIPYGVTTNLTLNAFERMGYEFAGWTNQTQTTAISDGAAVSNLATEDGATVMLFAKWSKNSNPLGEALGISELVVTNSLTDAWVPQGKDMGVTRTSTSPSGSLSIVVPCAGVLMGTFAQDSKPNKSITVTYNGSSENKSPGKLELNVSSGQSVVFSGTPASGKTWTLSGFTWTPNK